MTNLLGILLSLWLAFILVMVPRGMRPSTPEFWLTPWLYGMPVVVLAWPIYLQIFKRVPRAAWWHLSVIGLLLCPIPFFLLIVGASVIRGELPALDRPVSYYLPWNSIFTYWYALFGILFGAWVGLKRNASRTL